MKILHVTQGYFPAIGGTEWLIQRISEELTRQFGDEVTVFTTNCYNGEAFFDPSLDRMAPGWETINGVRVRRFPVYSRISQLARTPQALAYHLRLPGNEYLRALAGGPIISGLGKAIREHDAEVISASSFPLLHMFTALDAAKKTARPSVLTGALHPQDEWGFNRAMIYRAIAESNAYVAYTQFEANYVQARGANASRVFVIGLGVDAEKFDSVNPNEAKRRYGLEDKPTVGFIGQLGRFKGVSTLVKAMPIIWNVLPEAHLLIAGGRTLFVPELEKMISHLPEAKRKQVISVFDFREEDKPALFSAIDVLAYPSGYESFGISYLEAWAAGKPVIGARRGAIPWVIHQGRDGLLIEFTDYKRLAEAVLLVLKNPGWARSLGARGKEKVLDRYTWQTVACKFREVYQGTIERNRSGIRRGDDAAN